MPEVEIVQHPCPHCGQPTDPRAVRCVHCRQRLVPLSAAQKVIGLVMAALVVTALVAVGGVLFASCATGLVIALVLGPVLALVASLFARRRR